MHTGNQFDLLRERRFAPFFWTQFLGAGNDNVYKNALIIFVAFHAARLTTLDPNALVNLAGAVFIAPFVLLSATSGQIADKVEKSRLIRWIKLFEIAIMVVGLAGFWRQNLTLMFTALALLGIHSALFGPVKYAILPQHLKPEELIGGNGLVEMGTFVAILLGTIAGGVVVAIEPNGPILACALAIAIAVAGYLVSRGIPHTPAVAPDLAINWNPFSETWRNLRIAQENRVVWLSMLGISWFWFYGAIFLAQFAGFSRDVLGGNEHVVTFLLALFSVGIGVGSLLCERLSGRKIELGLVPFGSIGLTLFAADLWLASDSLHATEPRWPRCVFRQACALARCRRSGADRPLRRVLHRSPVRADPGALGAVAPFADHRRKQHPECDLHRRVGGHRGRAARRRPVDSAALPGQRADECGGRGLHLRSRPRVPDALPRVASRPHVLPRG